MKTGLEKFIGEHRKEIFAATGVVAAGALMYFVFGKKHEVLKSEKKAQVTEEQMPIELPKHESDIHVKYIEGKDILTKETLLAIHSLIAKQLAAKYLKKTIESRQSRRKQLKFTHAYIKECRKLQEALDQIITQVTSKILLELKLDPDAYQKAYDYHTKQEGSDAFLDKVAVPDPDNVPSQVQLSKQKVLGVYDYQNSVLEEVVSEVVGATGHDEASNQEIDHFVEFRLLDLTAFNLNIEEEDLLNKYNFHYLEDPDVKALIMKKEQMKKGYITRFS